MSRYQPVRPKPGRPAGKPQPTPDEAQQRFLKAVQQAADALYLKSDGASIDKAIERAERTLELFDREVERLASADADEKPKWLVSPAIALRWQRELERQQERKQTLMQKSHSMAREIIQQWMQESDAADRDAAPEAETPEQPSDPAEATGVEERGDAEAVSEAA